jgi:hypothetical protein
MTRLDRLGWAAGASGTCLGVRVGLRVSDAQALPGVLSRLPPGWSRDGRSRVETLYSVIVGGPGGRAGVRRMHLVYADARLLAQHTLVAPHLDEIGGADFDQRVCTIPNHGIQIFSGRSLASASSPLFNDVRRQPQKVVSTRTSGCTPLFRQFTFKQGRQMRCHCIDSSIIFVAFAHIDAMPLTAERVWNTIQGAKGAR